jgi:hypothetical protein
MAAQENPRPVVIKRESEEELMSWRAPARPFKRRNREFYITIIAIAFIFGLVFFLIEGFLPVILIIALVFLVYVMSTVEPENIEYKITNRGIKIDSRRTDWDLMRRFWFTKRFDTQLLVIETTTLIGRLELVIQSELKPEITKTLSKYLIHEEVPPSYLDKATNWLTKRLPQA